MFKIHFLPDCCPMKSTRITTPSYRSSSYTPHQYEIHQLTGAKMLLKYFFIAMFSTCRAMVLKVTDVDVIQTHDTLQN